jgi:hypothetical protein
VNDGYREPSGEAEWSRRGIINVVAVLAAHADSLTLIGAHAVLLRTADLDVPMAPTSDGDLGVTPGLVGEAPSIEQLLSAAEYEHRTTARPGLWGRGRYVDRLGAVQFHEKIDLLAPHALAGTVSRTVRGVPALRARHGKLSVGSAVGIELAAFNRSRMTLPDLADPRLSTEINVAEVPALLLAKGAKVGERLTDPRKGQIRDKDLGDVWRLLACADPDSVHAAISKYSAHPAAGENIRRAVKWSRAAITDPASREHAKRSLEGFIDPAEIDRVFNIWNDFGLE